MNIQVLPLDESAGTGGKPRGPFSESGVFFAFRNSLLAVLRRFGSVGPLGDRPIKDIDTIDHEGTWPVEEINPTFFVVDDQYFAEQTFVRVEVEAELITRDVLAALLDFLKTRPGWAVGLAVYRVGKGLGYLLVFGDRMMIDGPLFATCSTVGGIVEACQEATA